MAVGQLAPTPMLQFFSPNGGFLSFGTLNTYAAGTNTRIATYQDAALSQVNTNPITLNAQGQCSCFLSPGTAYKFIVFDSNGNQVEYQDNILGIGSGSQGAPGVNAVMIFTSAPALQVAADSSGNVLSFAQANGQLYVFSGNTNVTELCTVSLLSQVNCTATLNLVDNIPNAGQPLGFYQFNGMSGNIGSITIQAIYLGVIYNIQVTISKSIAGSSGSTGPAGPTGPPGPAAGLSLVLSNASSTVLAYANGNVPSFAGINGIAHMLNAGTDVSESTTWSAVANGVTGTINTADNVPVAGQPIGYYQVTAMSQNIGNLTISATYSGSTIIAVYTVTQVPTGYQIVSSLPAVGSAAFFQGNIVFLTLDNQLYRNTGTGWTLAVPAVNITGTIGTSQISPNAITSTLIAPGSVTTPALAANSVTAAAILANTITANQIASDTITSLQIAANTIQGSNILAGTITGNNIQAGSITAANIGVTSLSAISANVGTVTSGLLESPSGANYLDLTNSKMVFNNGVYMVVRGNGFGAAGNYIEWYGPTQSSASNFAACTDALGLAWQKTDGTQYYAGSLPFSNNHSSGSTYWYTTLPSGQIMQGGFHASGSSPFTIALPNAFPNFCAGCILTPANTSAGVSFTATVVNTSTISCYISNTLVSVYWLAFGN